MAQDDLVIANQTFPNTRADINANLQALGSLMSGSSAPATTYAYMWWADTTNGVLKQRDASNAAWVIRATLSDDRVVSKTANYTIALGDYGKLVLCSASGGAFTITLLAAATAGDGFRVTIKKTDSTATAVTIDGNSSETVDGTTTVTLDYQYDSFELVCDGSNWHIENNSPFTMTRPEVTLASATTTDLGSVATNIIAISGTTTITGLGSTATTRNPVYFIRFTGALTLTHNGTSLILPGSANITTVAGDSAVFEYMGSGNWRCLNYQKIDGTPVNAKLISVQKSVYISAEEMKPLVSGGCAAVADLSAGAGYYNARFLAFDPTTVEAASFLFAPPKGWNLGVMQYQAYWSHPATTTNFGVRYAIGCAAYGDGDAFTAVAIAQGGVNDTGGATDTMYITDKTNFTPASPAAGDMIMFQIARDTTNGADTLAVDARLHGIMLYYTITTHDDT